MVQASAHALQAIIEVLRRSHVYVPWRVSRLDNRNGDITTSMIDIARCEQKWFHASAHALQEDYSKRRMYSCRLPPSLRATRR